MAKNRQVSIRIEEETFQEWKELASRWRVSMPELLEQAVREFGEPDEPRRATSSGGTTKVLVEQKPKTPLTRAIENKPELGPERVCAHPDVKRGLGLMCPKCREKVW